MLLYEYLNDFVCKEQPEMKRRYNEWIDHVRVFTLRINSGSCSTIKFAKRISSFRFESVDFLKSGWLNRESAREFKKLFYKDKEQMMQTMSFFLSKDEIFEPWLI